MAIIQQSTNESHAYLQQETLDLQITLDRQAAEIIGLRSERDSWQACQATERERAEALTADVLRLTTELAAYRTHGRASKVIVAQCVEIQRLKDKAGEGK